MFSPENFFFTKKPLHTKITQPLHKENPATYSHKKRQSLKKKHILSAKKKSQNLQKKINHATWVSEKKHATSPHTKIMQPLHAQNHATSFLSRNLSTKKNHSTSSQEKHATFAQKITQSLLKKITQPPQTTTQKSRNLSTHKIMQPLNKKNHLTSPPK